MPRNRRREGHDWQGATVLLLTTTGRNSGAKRTTPLIYQRHETTT
ncbi:MAG: nitroreductase/quinone reductase family protein [Solirubrobacteraceae bacterium]